MPALRIRFCKNIFHRGIHDFAVARDATALGNFIIKIRGGTLFGKIVEKEIDDVLRIHLTRVYGQCAREIDGADNAHAVDLRVR